MEAKFGVTLPSGYVKIAIENGHRPYPLVMTNIAIEHGHRNSEFSHEKWWIFP